MATVAWLERDEMIGRPPGSDLPVAEEITIGFEVDDGVGGTTRILRGPMGEAEAAALGWPRERRRDALVAMMGADRDAARAEAAGLRRERDALRAERDALAAQLAAFDGARPSAPAPTPVSDRQFFQALALAGAIGPDEALAAVMTGVLPGRIEAAVAALPEAQQFAARMLLSGATTFERGHPMVAQLGSGLGYDAAALDGLWSAAAAL